MSAHETVSIYDPNGLNPYGLEVARIISSIGRDVHYWGVASRYYPDDVTFTIRSKLAGAVRSGALLSQITRRVLRPVQVALSAPRSSPLVVVWIRDPWDAAVFLCRASLGGRTLLVYHNPAQVRPRTGLRGRLERRLLRHSRVCVHAEWMADLVGSSASDIVITPHPPFSFAAERASKAVPSNPGSDRVAVVGGLRADKGADDLPAIARASGGGWTLLVAGPDVLSAEIGDQLRRTGVRVEYATRLRAPTDDEMHAAMIGSKAVLAPYTLVTESGSVLLALSLGVPVLGYPSDSLSRLLTKESLADSPKELGETLKSFLLSPWETFRISPEQLAADSRRGWEVALG